MTSPIEVKSKAGQHKVKCVVWDLDHTIWDGIVMEDAQVHLHDHILEVIQTLDHRGILQSIASRNEPEVAAMKLKEFGIEEYFIYPQVNWNSKSASIQNIAESINIGLDTIAFIDDQAFEREEVNYLYPQVLCLDASESRNLLDRPEFNPTFVTEDSKNRRQMYMNDIVRKNAEESFEGIQDEFLSSLNMVLTVAPVEGDDLKRVEELTLRTHQLNATGYTYSYEELNILRESPNHKLWICGLDDKYGTYGKIGLVLLECIDKVWTLKLLLVSCRVISRGVGSIMLNLVARKARDAGAALRGEFVPTNRNRMMLLTYKFAGFKELEEKDGIMILAHDLQHIPDTPEYIRLESSI